MIDPIVLALAASERGDVTLGIPEERRRRPAASTLPVDEELFQPLFDDPLED